MKEKNSKTEQPNQGPDSVDASTSVRLEPVLANLQPRQRVFVLAYLKCGIGAQAAREAGYAKSGARNRAAALMKVPAVRAAIDEGRRIMAERTGYDVDAAMAEFAEAMAFAKATRNASALVNAVTMRARIAGLLDPDGPPPTTPLMNITIDLGNGTEAQQSPLADLPMPPALDLIPAFDVIPAAHQDADPDPMQEIQSPTTEARIFHQQFPEIRQPEWPRPAYAVAEDDN